MTILVDTNILLRSVDQAWAEHLLCVEVRSPWRDKTSLYGGTAITSIPQQTNLSSFVDGALLWLRIGFKDATRRIRKSGGKGKTGSMRLLACCFTSYVCENQSHLGESIAPDPFLRFNPGRRAERSTLVVGDDGLA